MLVFEIVSQGLHAFKASHHQIFSEAEHFLGISDDGFLDPDQDKIVALTQTYAPTHPDQVLLNQKFSQAEGHPPGTISIRH